METLSMQIVITVVFILFLVCLFIKMVPVAVLLGIAFLGLIALYERSGPKNNKYQ